MNEYVFSFAANYNDRLYLGMTMGLPYIRYLKIPGIMRPILRIAT